MILLALALKGLAGEQPYTFPRKSQLRNQPGILSIRARIGALSIAPWLLGFVYIVGGPKNYRELWYCARGEVHGQL